MGALFGFVATGSLAYSQEGDARDQTAEPPQEQAPQGRADQNDSVPLAQSVASGTKSIPSNLLAEEDQPTVFYLPDAEGKLQKVIGYRYEDFLKAQGITQKALQQQAVLEACELAGKVVDDAADLQVKLTISKTGQERLAFPISLGNTVLKDVRFSEKATNCATAFDAQRHTYLLWLPEKLEGKFDVELQVAAKIESVAGLRRLALSLPPAAKSTLALEIEGSEIELSAPGSRVVANKQSVGNRSRIDATGVTGTVELTWLPKLVEGSASRQIEANLDIQAEIDLEEIQYQCLLGTNTGNQPIESYLVLLPESFQLSEEVSDESYTVRRVRQEKPQTNPGKGDLPSNQELLEIRFPAPVSSPPLVVFRAENRLRSNQSTGKISLAIPRLVGAYRQSGFLSVVTSDRLQSYFDITGKLDQISPDDLPDSLTNTKVAAAFQYAGTAGEVIAHTQPRIERIRVRPEYELFLDAEEATLAVDFRYEISAAKLFSLRIDLKDWQMTEQPVESGGLVDRSRLHPNSENLLILPLESPAEESARIRFLLSRPVELGLNKATLPEPLGAAVLPGRLSITNAESLLVSPQLAESRGITIAKEGRIASSEGNPATLDEVTDSVAPAMQFSVFSPEAELGLALSERPGEVETTSRINIRIEAENIAVEQGIGFDVRFEPLQQVELTAPRELWLTGNLEFTWEGRSVEVQAVDAEDLQAGSANVNDENSQTETSSELLKLRVNLPKSLIGSGLLKLRYSTPRIDEISGTSEPLRLSFCEPITAPKKTIATVVSSADSPVSLDIANDGGQWATAQTETPAADQLVLEHVGGANLLPLLIDRSQQQDSSRLRLDRTWVQTWLAGNTRQDRSVFHFESDRSQIKLALPEAWPSEGIEVVLDGQPVESIRGTEQELVIGIQAVNELREHTLEIRTLTTNASEVWQKIDLQVPELIESSADAPFVWQIIVPETRSLVGASGNLVGEYRLGWNHFRWGRQPLRGQRELEHWSSASPASLEPSEGTNAYLFSALQIPRAAQARFVPAQLLYWLAIAVVFLIGAICLYTTLWRHPLFWLLSTCLLLLIVFSQPHLALLAAQVLVIAGGLVVGTALLRRWLTVEPSKLSTVLPSESIDIRTISTGIWQGSEEVDSAATVAPSPTNDVSASGISNSGAG